MTPPLRLDDMDRALQAIRAKTTAQPTRTDDDMDTALAALRQPKDPRSMAERLHGENKTGNLARRMATNNATDAAESSEPSGTTWRELLTHPRDIPQAFARSAMATEANLARGFAPLAVAQDAARALWHGQSYRDARNDLEGEVNRIPSMLRNVERGVGAAPVAALAPAASIPQAMAGSGVLSWMNEAANDNPDVTAAQRSIRAPIAGSVSAGASGLVGGGLAAADWAKRATSLIRRVQQAPTYNESAVATDKAIADATKQNYGLSTAEGEANGGTSPALAKVLERPRIKQYVDMVRDGEEPMSDAEVTREVSKLMSRARRGHQTFMEKNGYDAARDLEAKRLGKELKILRDATAEVGTGTRVMETAPSPKPTVREAIDAHQRRLGQSVTRKEGTTEQQMARTALERHGAESEAQPPIRGDRTEYTVETDPAVMPSFPHAVAEKARMEDERQAGIEAAEMGSRIARGMKTPPRRAASKSPEAWLGRIPDRPQNEAQAALRDFVSGVKGDVSPRFTPLPWALGGATGGGIFGGGPGVVAGAAGGVATGAVNAGLRSMTRLNRVLPYYEALERAAGKGAGQQLSPLFQGAHPKTFGSGVPSRGEDAMRLLRAIAAALGSQSLGSGNP